MSQQPGYCQPGPWAPQGQQGHRSLNADQGHPQSTWRPPGAMAAPELQTGASDSPMSVTFTPARPTCSPMSTFTRAQLKDL